MAQAINDIPLPHFFVTLKYAHAGDYLIHLDRCVDCGCYSIAIHDQGRMVGGRGGGDTLGESLIAFWEEVGTGLSITRMRREPSGR